MKRWIASASIVLLGSFVLILMDDFNQEWKQIQHRFTEIPENVYRSTVDEDFSFNSGIQQIVSAGLGRVDRCITCHLGIDDAKYISAEQPFRTHPGNILATHDIKRFGCTSCHLGQGFAVSYEGAAHRKLEFWNETMLPHALMQSSCGTCHLSEEVPETGILTKGRLLIKDKGCTGCHEINDFFEEERRGPDLDGIGNKVTRAWLYNWLKDPRDYLVSPRMPSFRFNDEQLLSLVAYLMSFDGRATPPHPITAMPLVAGDPDRGKILVSESRCISCHAIKGRGGTLAPELERIGDKVREEWLPNFLRNVHYYQASKTMLQYNFDDQEALDVAAFLLDEFWEEGYELPADAAASADRSTRSQRRELIDAGQRLFNRSGCGGCHDVPDHLRSPKVGPKLSNIGNRLESKLDFGVHDDVLPTLYNWIFMKIKEPTVFDSTGIMPHYLLSDEEAYEITTALLGNKANDYATEFLVLETERSLYKKPGGEFGELFERYSCISCHSIDMYGGTLSTVPLTIEGSTVQYEWLKSYLIKPYAIRPILTERMPRFRMTEKEAALIADYIKRVYVSDEIPRYMEYDLSPADVPAGEELFRSLACATCHIIDDQGGYLGPELDNTGRRLEAGWVFMWLLHPQKYRPETIHPDFDLSDEDARQLTAYLMTKKRTAR